MGGYAGEPGQDRLGGCGSVLDRGGVLDHLVVVLVDQVPSDRAVQCRGQAREPVRRAGRPRAEQPRGVDPFDPGQQVDAQQPGDAEPDLGLAVGVRVVPGQVHRRAVPHRALDHGGDLGGGGFEHLGVHDHVLLLHVPVHQNPAAAVAGVPLGEQVLVPGPKVRGVRGGRGRGAAPQPLVPRGERSVCDTDREGPGNRRGQVAPAHIPHVLLVVRPARRDDRAVPVLAPYP